MKRASFPLHWIKYGSMLAGLIFGWLGWALLKLPITEPAGLVLLYFPVRVFCSLAHITATDGVAVPFTTALYGIAGFSLGWSVEIFRRRRHLGYAD